MRLALPSVTTLAATLAAAALFALPAAAASGTAAPAAPTPPAASAPSTPSPAGQVSDQKLGQAATAMEHVMTLRKSYEQKLDKASPQDKPRIADEGEKALKKAVTDQGLSLDEYNSIILEARNDPAFREKLLAHVKTQQ